MSRAVMRDGAGAARNGSALLRTIERRLRLTQRNARLGWWDWDLVRDRTTWTDELYRIFGRRRGRDRVSYEEFIKCVHPDDLKEVRSIVRKAFRSRAPVALDYRIVRPNGRVRWLRCKSQTVFDRHGRAIRMFGTEQDITDLKETEEALRDSEGRLRLLVEGAGDHALVMLEPDGRVASWSAQAERIYGYRAGEILGQRLARFYPRGEARRGRAETSLRIARTGGRYQGEGWRSRKDGSRFWANETITPLRSEDGRLRGFGQITRDVTARRRAEATLHSLLAITRDLNSTLDVEAHLERLVRSTLALVGAEGGWAGLREGGGMVTRVYLWPRRSVPLAKTWAPGEGLAGWVATHRAPCIVNGARRDPRLAPETSARFGIRTAACIPLLDTRGEAIGFFEVHNKKAPGGFDAADERTLALVAQASSVAIQNALAHRELRRTLEALSSAEAKYRDMYENSIEGIGQCTPDGRVVAANPALARMLGYDSEREMITILTDVGRQVYVDPARREEGLRLAEKYGSLSGFEAELYRRDGSTVWVSMNLRVVRDRRGRTRYYETSIHDISARRRAEESLRELTGHLLRSQEEERRRIARELHDSTAQSLAALAMNLSLVQRAAAGDGLDPKARQRLADSLELAEQCCRELRSLSYLLHPPALHEAGLRSAMRRYSEGFASRSGIQVDLRVASRLGRLPEEVEKTLFRIVQESLANIHRHSGSQRARIRLARDRRQVRLTVQDEGRGLHGEAGRRAAAALAIGVGISGMQERVRQLGGRFAIDSGTRGTSVSVSLPLPAAAAPAAAAPGDH